MWGSLFFQSFNDRYSKREKEEMFNKAINDKRILKLKELCGDGELLTTTIYLKNDSLFIHRISEYEDWFQEGIYLDESQLLQLINEGELK